MPKVNYIEHDGTEHTVEGSVGQSVMEIAVKQGVPGIDADCGGACACGTCHVYVDAAWLDLVGQPLETEQSMLEFATGVAPNSRLSCQMKMREALDGLIVRLPVTQR